MGDTWYSLHPVEPERWAPYVLFRPGNEPEAFTPEECTKLLDYADALSSESGTVIEGGVAPKIRDVNVSVVPVCPEVMWAYDKIVSAARGANAYWWHFDITHLLNIEVLRYEPGQHYVNHVDLGMSTQTRKLSVVLMLSDPKDYTGGDLELRFAEKVTRVPKEQGTMVVFPSWTLHRVTPVKTGLRRTATAWVQGPAFR